ncbi:ABC transporter substrate-binding protein [Actinoallomurus sp. CA-150999]|uniref:ABC transporter substrate-binding protein n=1 Tax=Actinoallomurus sp. CA-150999 TaxID=3239887 RepID=UPI003D92E189
MIRNRTRRALTVLAAGLALGLGAAACGGGGGDSKTSGPVHIKVWAWYPDFDKVVANFNNTHTDVKVDAVQAGVGQDEYTKLKTALAAKHGAPDVVMLEFQELPTIEITRHLVDMGKYGAKAAANDYADWAWKEVSDGDKVYAIPVDAGPMAMLYRKDIFDKYHLTVPKTWAEFQAQAKKLKAADPNAYMTAFGNNEAAAGWLQGLMWQAGSKPYQYSASTLPNVGVKLNDPASKQVMQYWGDMVKQKLAEPVPYGETNFYNGLSTGRYATYIAAGWGPGYLAGVAKSTAGKWRAAPIPQWTAGGNAQGDWGGSTFAVTDQTKHPKEATEVAMNLFGTHQDQWKIGIDQAFLFPTAKSILHWDYFVNKTYPFFGDQKVNQVFVPASDGIGQFDWSPFQDYAYNTLVDQVGQAQKGSTDWPGALDGLQNKVTSYAKQQGFTVH